MKLLYIGSGFVGACSAAVSASSGHSVLVYDIDEKKIEMLSSGDRDTIESCLFEEGLGDLLVRNKERIEFTTDYDKVKTFLDDCDGIFLCLPTPEVGETGESDMTYYDAATTELAHALKERNGGRQEQYIILINKSTVPIDTVGRTQNILDEYGAVNCGVVSNPEFLVEGKAIQGSLKPDRVVVGAWNKKDFDVMRNIYERFYQSPTVSYIEVNPKEAAASKLLANFYLMHKLIACYDVIGRTCETFDDLQFENIRKILVSDKRIGGWGLFDSLFAGGSCLVKDIRSLSHQLQTAGTDASLVNEIYQGNKRQLELFMSRAERDAGFDWAGKTVALLGTAFKRDTNDVRNSASIDIMHFLQEKQVGMVKVYDPAAIDAFQQLFPASDTVIYTQDEGRAMIDANVVIISTDWPQFRELGDVLLSSSSRPLLMDGRRILHHKYGELQQAGFSIIAVGSPF